MIRVPADVWTALRSWLLEVSDERMAYLLARATVCTDPWGKRQAELLVFQAIGVPERALAIQSGARVEVDPSFSGEVLRTCYEGGLSLIDIHTHPFVNDGVSFSSFDVDNMRTTHAELLSTIPQEPPALAASLVIGRGSVAGSWLDPDTSDLTPVTALRLIHADHESTVELSSSRSGQRAHRWRMTDGAGTRFDRQVRAFGKEGQRKLRSLTVAVVGVGGTGSLMVQSLAHLGVGRLLLVDRDRLDETSLNRTVGARPGDVKHARSKVGVAARHARGIDPDLPVMALRSTILDPETWSKLRCADVIIGGVDTHAARWALNLLAVQYGRLYLDVGVEIGTVGSGLEVGGHVAVVRPNGPCLRCLQGYDSNLAAAELQPELRAAKIASGYLRDVPNEPAPSVIFLNQGVVAFAIAELLNWVAPWKDPTTYALVDFSQPAVMSMDAERDPDCPICGRDGVRGLADGGGIPTFALAGANALPPAAARSNDQ